MKRSSLGGHAVRILCGLAGLAILARGPAAAQQSELRIGQDLPVGVTPQGKLMIEPHLAAHPSDPNRLLAVGIAAKPDFSEVFCLVFVSSDGGQTWTQQRLDGAGCGDPWVSLVENRAVITALGTHPALPHQADQLLAFVSMDGGSAWPFIPQSLGSGHDGPRTLASADGTVYVTSGELWTDSMGRRRAGLFVGRALHATPHVEVQTRRYAPSNLNQNMEGAAVLSDGVLLVTYQDFQRPVGGTERAFRGRAGALETRRVWAIASPNGGRSLPEPTLVTEDCWARPTFLAVDATDGPYKDRLYHVCPGEDLKSILVASSSDGGWEWTDATPVEKPAEAFGSRNFPVISVNNEGVVMVAWMDRRDDASGGCYAPYVSASMDGGSTFTSAVRVASSVSCPDPARTGQAGSRFRVGGDYFGLAAAADSRFHVLWPDAREGVFTLRTATVAVEAR